MLKIEGKKIWLTRGDYAEIDISVVDNDSGQAHVFIEGETVIFRVGGTYKIEKECVIDLTENTCTLILEEEDTEDFRFGNYKYEFEYINVYGKPDTFIANEDFIITPEQEEHDG